jgi:hypothetical protein
MTTTSQEPGGASRVSSRGSRPPRPQHWRDVESRAQKAYNEWYDGPEVFAEVDSLSHEFVREIAPDLIAALHSAASTANAAEARLDGTRRKSEDYELRAKAAEATLAKVRAWADYAIVAHDGWSAGFGQAKNRVRNILDGKTP